MDPTAVTAYPRFCPDLTESSYRIAVTCEHSPRHNLASKRAPVFGANPIDQVTWGIASPRHNLASKRAPVFGANPIDQVTWGIASPPTQSCFEACASFRRESDRSGHLGYRVALRHNLASKRAPVFGANPIDQVTWGIASPSDTILLRSVRQFSARIRSIRSPGVSRRPRHNLASKRAPVFGANPIDQVTWGIASPPTQSCFEACASFRRESDRSGHLGYRVAPDTILLRSVRQFSARIRSIRSPGVSRRPPTQSCFEACASFRRESDRSGHLGYRVAPTQSCFEACASFRRESDRSGPLGQGCSPIRLRVSARTRSIRPPGIGVLSLGQGCSACGGRLA